MIWHVPGAPYAQQLIFKEPEQLGALIEQMIAHRNFVFPDADPIDPDTQLKEGRMETRTLLTCAECNKTLRCPLPPQTRCTNARGIRRAVPLCRVRDGY